MDPNGRRPTRASGHRGGKLAIDDKIRKVYRGTRKREAYDLGGNRRRKSIISGRSTGKTPTFVAPDIAVRRKWRFISRVRT